MQYTSSSAFFLLIPLLFAVIWMFIKRKDRTPYVQYSSFQTIAKLAPSFRVRIKSLPLFLKIISIVLMIIALARPQSSSTKIKRNVDGIDIILLVDLSPTMMIEDMNPHTRLEAAKIAQIEFVKNRPTDRIGIVAFSGEAYTAVPPTLDHKVVIERLSELTNSDRLKPGTAQGVAIATGVSRLKDSKAKSRIMVFITDGENNTGLIDPETALGIAKQFGIKIYTVGVGSDGPKQLPIIATDAFGRKNKRYQPMTSAFHEDAMQRIASETGGKYWRSESTKELKQVYSEIDKLEKTKIDSNTYTKYHELYLPYTLWAIIIYLASWLLAQTWLRRSPG